MAGSVIAGLITGATTAIVSSITFGKFLAVFAVSAGLSAISKALAPKPEIDDLRGITVNKRDPISAKRLIYGKTRVGGTLVMMGSSGTNNENLTLVIAVAGHRVNAFKQVYLNDELAWDADQTPNYQGVYYTNPSDPTAIPPVELEFIVGSDTNITSSLATAGISGYTSSHKMNGNAAIVIKLNYNPEVYTSGIPNVSAVIEGNRVYDPRQNEYSPYYDSSIGSGHRPNGTWTELGYTSNPALILLDYIRDEKYGLGEDISNIDQQSFVDAADICDESVAKAGGGTQLRYTCDGVLDTSKSIKANIEDILTSMLGTLTIVGGKYVLNAYAYKTPSLDIDESDLISPISVTTKQSRRNLYNAVKGTFISADDNYIPADYPAQTSSTYANDDGETIYLDMTLPMTNDHIRAQRIARLVMLKSRLQTTVSMTVNLKGLQVQVGDNIRLTNARLGYSNKIFEVTNFNLLPDPEKGLAVQIEAIENDSAAYVWNTSDQRDFTVGGTVSLYSGRTASPVTGLTLSAIGSVNDDGSVTPAIEVSFTDPADAYTEMYEIHWRNATDSGNYKKTTTLSSPHVITGVRPNKSYEIKVFAINERNVRSAATTATVTTPSDFIPNVPSFYRITKTDANAPTTAEFNSAAGRTPKNNDIVLTTNSTTTPATAYAWNYDASTSAWVRDDNLLTGDLIIDGTIGTANIANAAITDALIANLSADKINAGTLSADRINIDGVTLDTDGSGTLIIKDGGVSATQIAATSITTAKIVNDAVTNALIATDAVNQDSIAANSVTATEIATNTITANEIAAATITGAQIAADTIAVNKLTGDVNEIYPLMLSPIQSLTTTAWNSPVFSLHAPALVSKKPKIDARIDLTISNGSSTDRVMTFDVNIQIKSKGGSAVQIGATGGVTVTFQTNLRTTLYVSGDHTNNMDYVGAVANNSSGTNFGTITGMYYDAPNNRTYVDVDHSSASFTNGSTLYWHPFAWTSAGTWTDVSTKENVKVFSPAYNSIHFVESINVMSVATNTATDFRVRASVSATYTMVTGQIKRLTGTLELIS